MAKPPQALDIYGSESHMSVELCGMLMWDYAMKKEEKEWTPSKFSTTCGLTLKLTIKMFMHDRQK